MKPHLITKAKTTEKRSIIGWRCGKWVLRSINVRKSRGQNPALKLAPQTPISKRKRPAPSPTSLANSVIGENNVEVVLLLMLWMERTLREEANGCKVKSICKEKELQKKTMYLGVNLLDHLLSKGSTKFLELHV